MAYELVKGSNGVEFIRFPGLEAPHAFSTRKGGRSKGEFSSLNLGFYCGDNYESVTANRHLFEEASGLPVTTCLKMEHGDEVVVIDGAKASGLAERGWRGDACVTDLNTITLAVTVADCMAVFFYDPVTGSVGVAHAGWRGTVAGITAATVSALVRKFDSKPENLIAVLSPAIGPCCFEVGEEVADRFYDRFGERVVRVNAEGGNSLSRFFVDLRMANELVLAGCGLRAEHIYSCDLCTYCRGDLFYSYRRDRGRTGRMAAVIKAP